MRAKGLTDIGKLRENNEDCIFVPDPKKSVQNLYIVADGMGGYNAGEVASRVAVESFVKFIRKERCDNDDEDILKLLKDGAVAANKAVYEKSRCDKKCSEMGTTLVAATISKDKLFVVYAGDSRAYVFKKGELKQLTVDHSVVMEMVLRGEITQEESFTHPERNKITRAIGISATMETDTKTTSVASDDIVMLCTDGLSNMLTDSEMEEVLKMSISLDDRLKKLVDIANEKGGRDNISVILIDIGGMCT